MRITVLFVGVVALLGVPGTVHGQSFMVHGSAGPTLNDRGVSVAAGVGYSLTPRLLVLVDVERTHLFSRMTSDEQGGSSAFRGGTLTLVSPHVTVSIRGRDRVGPYGLVGFAAGVSRPNVNDTFPMRVTNDVKALFFGGGLHVPIAESLSVMVDARMMVGDEAGELLAVAPVRAGVSWRF